jgi:hypothetical protein
MSDDVSFGSDIQPSILFVPPKPGRCVGDPVEMQRARALMSIPTFDNPLAYITLMQSMIAEATTNWLAYKSAVTADYANAYADQAGTLKSVKKKMQERMEREKEFAVFALNLVTVGIGGALAGNAVKLGFKSLGAKEAFFEKAGEVAKEKISEPIAKVTEWGYKKLGLELEDDPFEPASMSPTEFGERMGTTLLYQSATLQGSLTKIQLAGGYTLQGVRNLAQIIIPSPFIQNAPKEEIRPGDLKAKALLALWLGWAWARDDAYWRVHGRSVYDDRDRNERQDFEPIRKKLLSIGVPMNVVSHKETEYHWMNEQEQVDRIDMPGFLDWAGSTAWIPLMFNKTTPQDDAWVAKMPLQMAQVKLKKAIKQVGGGED